MFKGCILCTLININIWDRIMIWSCVEIIIAYYGGVLENGWALGSDLIMGSGE